MPCLYNDPTPPATFPPRLPVTNFSGTGQRFIKFILLPIRRIINDIISYAFKFIIIPDYVVVKTGLPTEWKFIVIAPFRYRRFEGTYHGRNCIFSLVAKTEMVWFCLVGLIGLAGM